MLYFRADANSKIGSGHIMRCLAIANAAKKSGIESHFITADRESEQMIVSYGYPIICLDSLWDRLDTEIEKLIALVEKRNIKQLFIDSYFVTEKYLYKLREYTKVIYLDDLNEFIYPVDILINYNIYANKFNYLQNYKETMMLLGCEFVPLREEFQNKNPKISEEVKDILITTGGSDSYNVAGGLMKYLFKDNQYSNINFHIVVGSFNDNMEKLRKLEQKYSNVILHKNVTKMSKLMIECDIAITAGGSTLYELCACGIPSISVSFADNQIDGVQEFQRQNIIYYAGDIRDNIDICFCNIENHLRALITDKELRRKFSHRMKKVVDGYGANRIISKL